MSISMNSETRPAFAMSNLGSGTGSTAAGIATLAVAALQAFGQSDGQMNGAGYAAMTAAVIASLASMFGR